MRLCELTWNFEPLRCSNATALRHNLVTLDIEVPLEVIDTPAAASAPAMVVKSAPDNPAPTPYEIGRRGVGVGGRVDHHCDLAFLIWSPTCGLLSELFVSTDPRVSKTPCRGWQRSESRRGKALPRRPRRLVFVAHAKKPALISQTRAARRAFGKQSQMNCRCPSPRRWISSPDRAVCRHRETY
jgi:hypothetical protein